MNAFVLGYGVVGKATALALDIRHHYDISDGNTDAIRDFVEPLKALGSTHNRYYFICVPTPSYEDGVQNTEAMRDVVQKVLEFDPSPIFVLRSTVAIGTTRLFEETYKRPFIHFPEFLTESSALKDSFFPDMIYIGSNDLVLSQELKTFLTEMIGEPIIVKPETSELLKYAMNTFFATKVTLGNIFRDIAMETGADYWETQRALESHKWGSKNGWNPYHGNKRGFGGKCLPKDVLTLSRFDKTGFIKKMVEVNNEYQSKV